MAQFQIIDLEGKHGPTVYVDNPKLEALKYKFILVVKQKLPIVDMICHADGAYTVTSPGLMDMTFEPAKSEVAA